MTSIRNLAFIGNRRTAAAIDTRGRIVWYCPQRFDCPSLFGTLLDPEAGGWLIRGDVQPVRRRYLDESAVLETVVETPTGDLALTDWMPLGRDLPGALCLLGGERNYDYRYVWLRDAAMITSALARADREGAAEQNFLAFLCDAHWQQSGPTLPPFSTLDGQPAPPIETLPWQGYRGSRPVMIGNGAGTQLQLDGLANILLAAKLIYNRHGTRDHWGVVERVADFLSEWWREPDNGIWEEPRLAQYTGSKVIVARSLEFIADHSDEPAQARRRDNAKHGCRRSCLLGNLGQELAGISEACRRRVNQHFERRVVRIAACLREAQARRELNAALAADDIATLLLSAWQGALLRMRVAKSRAPLNTFIAYYFDTLLTT